MTHPHRFGLGLRKPHYEDVLGSAMPGARLRDGLITAIR